MVREIVDVPLKFSAVWSQPELKKDINLEAWQSIIKARED
jgi:hypothetical protein